MKIYRCGSFICSNNEFKFLAGVNYWPRKLNIRMWREWDENSIREDIEIMKKLKIRVVRVFIKNEDFADEDGNIVKEIVSRFKKFLDLLDEHNIQAFITFLVGHMSGKNWKIPWTSFDEIYTSKSIEKTMKFVENIVREIKDHKAVAGWILSNELSLVKKARNREEALAMLRSFSHTVKAIDRDHVISSGDVPDSYMQETHNVKEFVDYVGPHIYLYDNDPVRHSYLYAVLIEMFSNGLSHPVILEEFGFSTHQFSEESHAKFIYEILYEALAHGASGAFVWCFSDFVHESDPPYDWRSLELGFGLIKNNGSEKLAAKMFRKFVEEIEKLELLGINTKFRRNVDTFIVTPFYLWKDYEFIWYKDAISFFGIVKPLAAAYAMFTASGSNTGVVYELDIDNVLTTAKLIAVPSTIANLATTWRKFYNYVENGGNLYTSFVRGVMNYIMALHDAPTHLWTELLGLENTTSAGSIGRKIQHNIVLEFEKDFGVVKKGDKISIPIPVPFYIFRAKPVDAEVLAYDQYNEPVVFMARRGKGKIYTSLIPIEIALTLVEEIEWSSSTHKFYESIAIESNVQRLYTVKNPKIEIQTFTNNLEDIVIAINHSNEDIETTISSCHLIDRVEKISGNASIKTYTNKEIEVIFPSKSVLSVVILRKLY